MDNSRNGHSEKSVRSRFEKIGLEGPRDVKGGFEPVIVKHDRTTTGRLEDLIVSLLPVG